MDRKAKALKLGVGIPLGTRDNKSVAEIGEKHPLVNELRHLGVVGRSRVADRGDPSP